MTWEWIIEDNFSGSCRIKIKEPPDMAFNIVTAVELCETHKPTVALSIPFTAAGFHCQMRVMKNSNSN